VVDKVDLALGCPRLLPAIGKRTQGIAPSRRCARLATLDRSSDGGDARSRGRLARILPGRGPRQVAVITRL
jgi:hypothetical protein